MTQRTHSLKAILLPAVVTAAFLLVALAAMQFSEQVVWTWTDFLFAGVLLFLTSFVLMLLLQKKSSAFYRVAVGLTVLAATALVWINGAVGIIGDARAAANVLYNLMVALGLIGGFMTRFQSRRFASVLYLVAGAQVMIPGIAMLGWPAEVSTGRTQVFFLTVIFTAIWLSAGILVARDSRPRELAGN